MKLRERWYSERVESDVTVVRWGHFGRPVIIFPTAGGDAEEIERMLVIDALGEPQLLDLYRGLVRTRLIDVALKRFVKQGVISKAWLGTGEEAATVGPVHALRRGPNADIVAPMIRNSGACNEMGMPAADIFRAYMGTGDSPSHGRDGHYGDFSRGILPPVSIVARLRRRGVRDRARPARAGARQRRPHLDR